MKCDELKLVGIGYDFDLLEGNDKIKSKLIADWITLTWVYSVQRSIFNGASVLL